MLTPHGHLFAQVALDALGEFLEDIPFHAWIGYRREAQGGLYVADRNGINLWSFPKVIPRTWDTHNG